MNELTNPQTVSFLERATRDPQIDVSKLERIIDLQERQIAREAKRQFDEAMNALQSEMPQVLKDRANPHTRSRYATYEEVDRTIRPYYTKHGFSVRFAIEMKGDRIRVGCVVSRNGHSETCELESGLDTVGTGGRANKTDVQGAGSIVSYLKRYTIMAAFAVAVQDDETDDDGEGSRRAAAAPMPRGARVAERAPAYEAPPKPHPQMPNGAVDPNPVDASRPERTDAQWRVWLDKLRDACAILYHRTEVVQVAERPSVADALATGPSWVRDEVSAILAENYKRFAAEEPEAEGLPEVEITGEEKLAAGD